jgi:Helix-turn-helix domain
MRGRKPNSVVRLTPDKRAELERWQRSTTLAVGLVRRARVVLLLDEGQSLTAAARICGLTQRNARKWVLRYLERGLAGLEDKPGRGRKPVFSPRGCVASGQDRLRATG